MRFPAGWLCRGQLIVCFLAARTSKIFDGVTDFYAVALDQRTGEIKPPMQPNSSTSGPGDKLHPIRAGYAAMGNAVDLEMITGARR
jgi:hypothetical protein